MLPASAGSGSLMYIAVVCGCCRDRWCDPRCRDDESFVICGVDADKRLEDLLGVSVLQRVGRKVILTAAGEQLLAYAKRMVGINDDVFRG